MIKKQSSTQVLQPGICTVCGGSGIAPGSEWIGGIVCGACNGRPYNSLQNIFPELKESAEISSHDTSTNGLINYYKSVLKE